MKWALWLVVGPAAYILVSSVVELIVHTYFAVPGIKKATRYFEERAEGRQFSGQRMLWYLFAFAMLFGIALAVVAPIYGYVSDFIEQDRRCWRPLERNSTRLRKRRRLKPEPLLNLIRCGKPRSSKVISS